jgi:predicted restriction endonuclease
MVVGLAEVGTVFFGDNPLNEVTRERWLSRLAKLKIDLKGSPAPHKPLLLLVVIEMAEQGLLPKGTLQLTPELAFRFCTYWSIVAHRRRQKPDVRFPVAVHRGICASSARTATATNDGGLVLQGTVSQLYPRRAA